VLLSLIEWWQEEPPAAPYTFRVGVTQIGRPITEETYTEIVRLVNESKNLRSRLAGFAVSGTVEGKVHLAAGAQSGKITTVYPYTPEDIETAGMHYWAATERTINTVTVYPGA